MYFILSITKWNVNSKHYYGKLYSGSGSYVDLNNLYAGFYDNYDFRKQFEDLEKNTNTILQKTLTEKELIKQTFRLIKEKYNNDWLIVFYEGNFSKSRTEYSRELTSKRQTCL